jgi:hypothetical protein
MGEGGHTTTVIIVVVVILLLALFSAPIMTAVLGLVKDMLDASKDVSDSVKEIVDLLTGVIQNVLQGCSTWTGTCLYFEIFGTSIFAMKLLTFAAKSFVNTAAFFGWEPGKTIQRYFTNPTKTKLWEIAQVDATIRGTDPYIVFSSTNGDYVNGLKKLKKDFDAIEALKTMKNRDAAIQAVTDAWTRKFALDTANRVAERQGGTEDDKQRAEQLAQQTQTDYDAYADRLKKTAADENKKEFNDFIKGQGLEPE